MVVTRRSTPWAAAQKLALAIACLATGAAGQEPAERAAPTPLETLRPAAQVVAEAGANEWRAPDPENTLYVELESGRVVVELAPHFAPAHVAQMKTLAREGFYDGLEFYRVVDGFVAQGGDLSSERDIGSARRALDPELEIPIDPELPPFAPLGAADGYAAETGYVAGFPAARDVAAGKAWLVHCPGAVAMARDTAPDTGSTEFYVVIGHAPRYLDRNLTVFGQVLRGLDLLQKLNRGGPATRGVIENPDERGKILSIRVAADLPPEARTPLEALRTDSPSFRDLIAARRHRPEEFFVYKPDHIDVCGVPVPVRDPLPHDPADQASADDSPVLDVED